MATPDSHIQELNGWVAYFLPLALATALITSPWHAHDDHVDPQLYQVLARHMAEDKAWLNLRGYPGVLPEFRGHLPFGLWPFAAAIRLFGESALAPSAALFSLATLGLVGWLGNRLGGRSAAFMAMLVLGTTEMFFHYGGQSRLDPLLILLATAAAAPLLFRPISVRGWIICCVFGAAAVLVKGPFGLLPLVSAIAARGIIERSFPVVLIGTGVTLLTLVPVTFFLLWDKWMASGTWWNGYIMQQIVASALGWRTDGAPIPWLPFLVILKRFWPGLPLLLFGFWCTVRSQRKGTDQDAVSASAQTQLAMLSLLCVFIVLGLCLPARKWPHHTLVAFPWLAVFSGVASRSLLDKLLSKPERRRVLSQGLLALTVIISSLSLSGILGIRYDRPCVISQEFAHTFDQLRPGEDVWVVSTEPAWVTVALAAERRLVPRPTATLPVGKPGVDSQVKARIALVAEVALPQYLGPWQEIGRARGWVLLRST